MCSIFRGKLRRYIAGFLAFCMIMTQFTSVSWADVVEGLTQERVEFYLNSENIQAELRDAVAAGVKMDLEEMQTVASSSSASDYAELFNGQDSIYEIDPTVQSSDTVYGDGVYLRTFVRIDGNVGDSYTVTGNEDIIFMFFNGTDRNIDFYANIDGNKTQRVSVKAGFVQEDEGNILPEETMVPETTAADVIASEPETVIDETEAVETEAAETLSLSANYIPMVASPDDEELPDIDLIDPSNVQKVQTATTANADTGKTIKGHVYSEISVGEDTARALVVKLDDITSIQANENAEYTLKITHTMSVDGKAYKASDSVVLTADDFDEEGNYDCTDFVIEKEGISVDEGNLSVNKADFTGDSKNVNYSLNHNINYNLLDGYVIVTPEMKGRSASTGIFDLREAEIAPVGAIHTLTINYFYEENANSELSGKIAAQPYVATLLAGVQYNQASPEVKGFVPDEQYTVVSGIMGNEDVVIEVIYHASGSTEYLVKHYKEDLNGKYTLAETDTLSGKTGDNTKAVAREYTGFTVQNFKQSTIAASGSEDGQTVIEIKYSRNSHYFYFDSKGGSYVDTQAIKYEETVTVRDMPTRSGYTFEGWYKSYSVINGKEVYSDVVCKAGASGNITMADSDITIYAKWLPRKDVKFTVVHWFEKVESPVNGVPVYDFKQQEEVKNQVAGSLANVENLKLTNPYFTYEKNDTESNGGVKINGDGSTIVNIYYTRNEYKVKFDFGWKKEYGAAPKLVIGEEDDKKTYNTNEYVITAKYEANIADQWPIGKQFNVGESDYRFIYWTILKSDGSTSGTNSSRRITMTDEFCNNNKNEQKTTTLKAIWSKNIVKYRLNYMFESLDGTGEAYKGDDDNYEKKYIRDNNQYSQELFYAPSANWVAKEISGFGNGTENGNVVIEKKNGEITDANRDGFVDVWLYYLRRSYNLNFNNDGKPFTPLLPNKYKNIKFGTSLSNLEITAEYMNKNKPVGKEVGYEFKGWYTEPDGRGDLIDWDSFTMPFPGKQATGVLLYAYWAPIEYTVTLIPNNNTPNVTNKINYGSAFEEPEPPTRTGYTFAGWYETPNFTGSKYIFSRQVRDNLDLYAKWIPNGTVPYSVHYIIPAEGNRDYASVRTVTDKAPDISVTEEAVIDNRLTYVPLESSKSLILNATGDNKIVFEYVAFTTLAYKVRYISVDADGNELKELFPTKEVVNSPLAEVTENYVNIPGYLPDNYKQSKVLVNETTLDDVKENIITFKYSPAQGISYKAEYYLQDAENSEKYVLDREETLSAGLGAHVEISLLKYDTHTFNKSHPQNVISGIITSDNIMEGNQVVLKAYYDWNKYTVNYSGNTETSGSTIDTGSYRHGTNGPDVKNNGYLKDGYIFTHWNTQSDDKGETYLPGSKLGTMTHNVWLYAIWEKEQPELEVTKTIANKPINKKFAVGEEITYNITIKNVGNMLLNNIVVSDAIDGKGVVNILPGDGYTVDGDEVNIETLTTGNTITIKCTYKVVPEDNGQIVINKASAIADELLSPVESTAETEINRNYLLTIKYAFAEGVDGDEAMLPETITIPTIWEGNSKEVFASKNIVGYTVKPTSIIVTKKEEDQTIEFLYYKDASQTKDLSYTVEHWVEGEAAARDIDTENETRWINDPDTLTVKAVVEKKYTGYKFGSYVPEILPETIEKDGVIRVNYVKDTFKYNVHYFYEDAEKNVIEDKSRAVEATAVYESPISYLMDATTFDGKNYVFGKVEAGNEETKVTENEEQNYVNVYYYMDEIGGKPDPETPDKPKPDDIADKYQVTFTYKAAKHGSVGGTVTEVVTREKQGNEFSDTNPAYPSADVTQTPDTGYNFVNWKSNVAGIDSQSTNVGKALNTFKDVTDIRKTGFTENADFTASFIASDKTTYKVELYYESEGKYPEQTDNADIMTGTTDAVVTINPAEYVISNYILDEKADNVISGTVKGDNSLILKLYFKQQFSISYQPGINGDFSTQTTDKLSYGDKMPKFDGKLTGKPGYDFTGWDINPAETVTASTTYTATWRLSDNNPYKVEYYLQNLSGSYVLATDRTVSSADGVYGEEKYAYQYAHDITGYNYNPKANGSVDKIVITRDETVLKLYYDRANIDYTVEYYYNETLDENLTKTLEATYGSRITEYTSQNRDGYKLKEVQNLPLEISADAADNIIKVYYVKDNFNYQIEYYYDGVLNPELTHKGIAEFESLISDYPDKAITGYKWEGTENLPLSITSDELDNVIKVRYVKDTFKYNVHYFYEDADKNVKEDTSRAVEASAVYESPISYFKDATTFEGKNYVFGKVVAGNEEIKVTDNEQQNYVNVYYYMDEIGGTPDPETPDKPKPDDIADKYQVTFTYLAGSNGTVNGSVSEVVTREKQDGEFSDTNPAYPSANVTKASDVGYKFINWTSDNAGVNQRFLRADKVLTVFDSENEIQKTGFAADTVFTANFIANDTTTYAVWVYYESKGQYPVSTDNVIIQAGVTDTNVAVKSEDYARDGYIFDTTASNVLSGQIKGDNSLVLKLYYKQQFTVTYEMGDHGTFNTQTTGGLSYGSATPAFNGNISGESRYSFTGWSPEYSDTVTGNVTYVAQWRYAGGGSDGGDTPGGNGGDDTHGPGVPGDTVTVNPNEVPLAGLPVTPKGGNNNFTIIDDGEIPLAALPKTGNTSGQAAALMMAISGMLLAAYTMLSKKKNEK